MQTYFIEKIAAQFPEIPSGRSLLAVSGGIDSMTMLHLFEAAGWAYGIAHCNFQLRGADSDGDQEFVKGIALHTGHTFHSIAFDTGAEAAARGISIQMAARELRYPWLEAIRQEHAYDYIATAHHLSDSIETSLINQVRGTGLKGLSGIPPRQGHILRPLSAFTRTEIKALVDEQGIAYREDSSNAKVEYHRNRIRHQVIPVLRGINSAFEKNFGKNLQIWSASRELVDWACRQLAEQYVEKTGDQWTIDFRFIREHPGYAATLLYEWTRPLGFHPDQLDQALRVAGKSSGAMWSSGTHRLLADREAFLIAPLTAAANDKTIYYLRSAGENLRLANGSLQSSLMDRPETLVFDGSQKVALLDAGKVKFPLRVRHWRPGDVFSPLGMKGRRKKLQDFFSDLRLSRFEKEQVWLVLNADGHIVWVIGYRLDEQVRVDADTRKILKLEFQMD